MENPGDVTENILVIDTSSAYCCLALQTAQGLLDDSREVGRSHSEVLLPSIHNLLEKAEISLSDLDLLIFGQGPGSFTGLRITTGVIQGLAYGLSIPVIPVSVLAALAQRAHRLYSRDAILVALTARKEEVYWGGYSCSGKNGVAVPVVAEQVTDVAQLEQLDNRQWMGVGSGWALRDKIEQVIGVNVTEIDLDSTIQAEDLLTIGLDKYRLGQQITAEEAIPSYLREEVAS